MVQAKLYMSLWNNITSLLQAIGKDLESLLKNDMLQLFSLWYNQCFNKESIFLVEFIKFYQTIVIYIFW